MKTFKKSIASAWIMAFCLLFSVNVLAQNKSSLSDAEIASIAVTANRIDVDYAAIAHKRSSNAEILSFAKTMHDDHLSVIAQAKALCKKLGVTPKGNTITMSLLDNAEKTKEDLNAKAEGHAFNKAYIDNEVAYHKVVISTIENTLIPETQNKELKDLLISVLPVLKSHLEHAEMLMEDFK